jgi:FkbM family methyltransferase
VYSQYQEEQFIIEACEKIENGRLLDIGAWNATQFSNTRALYERGWSGVMFEPSPACMLGLLTEYGESDRITLVQAAVYTEPQLAKLHVTDDAVSTILDAEYEKWKNQTKFRGGVLVPCLTWPEIINRWGGFQFINIDAEGVSAELFLQMLQLGIFPECCCVEHESRLEELAAAATSNHYSLTYSNGTNGVFQRRPL